MTRISHNYKPIIHTHFKVKSMLYFSPELELFTSLVKQKEKILVSINFIFIAVVELVCLEFASVFALKLSDLFSS